MAKTVRLELTVSEAENLLVLAQEAEVETFGDDWWKTRAAGRAMEKLGSAIAAAQAGKARQPN